MNNYETNGLYERLREMIRCIPGSRVFRDGSGVIVLISVDSSIVKCLEGHSEQKIVDITDSFREGLYK